MHAWKKLSPKPQSFPLKPASPAPASRQTLSQSLMLLAVLILFSMVNMACPAERSKTLRMIEFLSTAVLCLTITLSLYFIQIPDDQQLSDAAMVGPGFGFARLGG